MKKKIFKLIRKTRIGRKTLNSLKTIFNREDFLLSVNGIVHVGANTGQERDVYKDYNLDVVWIEPIPEVFHVLEQNLEGYSRQRAFQYLITDMDDEEYKFNIASNEGESSSIFELNLHKDIWPSVTIERSIILESITLSSFVRKENITLNDYGALIMDTQGAELLVLKGAEKILNQFNYIKLEVADFEAYTGCCQLDEVDKYLFSIGFSEFSRHLFASRDSGGNYFDMVYKKMA
ncbi:FkbM family methyltransferase [Thermodesulfobacteriota bacterium]